MPIYLRMNTRRYHILSAYWGLLLAGTSCGFPVGEGPAHGPTEHQFGDRIEEPGLVPSHFAESATWNDASVCPDGAFLSAFTKYIDRSLPDSAPVAIRFGRECIKRPGISAPGRAPASSESPLEASMSETPHGPFIWWNSEGKVTRGGVYADGVLIRWSPKSQ